MNFFRSPRTNCPLMYPDGPVTTSEAPSHGLVTDIIQQETVALSESAATLTTSSSARPGAAEQCIYGDKGMLHTPVQTTPCTPCFIKSAGDEEQPAGEQRAEVQPGIGSTGEGDACVFFMNTCSTNTQQDAGTDSNCFYHQQGWSRSNYGLL